jgi:dTDP-4-amino-4,6-dideoxygalactose transaminase
MVIFNKFYHGKNELNYIHKALSSEKISGNGPFTNQCQTFLKERYNFDNCLLTNSCTDALEMAALLLKIKPGDEVIVPSYTFVSSANAFVLLGAKIVFADSQPHHPNVDVNSIEQKITPHTKAIVLVHYAGFACEMDKIKALADENNIFIIEDAAQAIDNYFITGDNKTPLGSIGDLATFSFHETKNISSGEGGMLVINNPKLFERAEIIWEKGTNRSAFSRGEINKYEWIDYGSSYLPSEITAALLLSQLEEIDTIQSKRISVWEKYLKGLKPLEEKGYLFPITNPSYSSVNAHAYFIVCKSDQETKSLLNVLKSNEVNAIPHYISLHSSPFQKRLSKEVDELPNSDFFTQNLIRLPLHCYVTEKEQESVIQIITNFFEASAN